MNVLKKQIKAEQIIRALVCDSMFFTFRYILFYPLNPVLFTVSDHMLDLSWNPCNYQSGPERN